MKVKDLIKNHLTLIKYMAAAFSGHVLNFITAYVLYLGLDKNLIFSNTTGLIVGFFFTFLASKIVFHKNHTLKGFLVYLGTFLLGMVLDNLIIKLASGFFIKFFAKNIAFLISKLLSGIVPFAVSYILRKKIFKSDFL